MRALNLIYENEIKLEIKNNKLIIIPKIEKYIEYMLTILLKLPRTEKFSIGTEIKTSMCKSQYKIGSSTILIK